MGPTERELKASPFNQLINTPSKSDYRAKVFSKTFISLLIIRSDVLINKSTNLKKSNLISTQYLLRRFRLEKPNQDLPHLR